MGGEEILEGVDLESNDANKIITFKDNLLNFDPDEVISTLDNFVEDISARANEEEPGETNKVVEVTTGTDNSGNCILYYNYRQQGTVSCIITTDNRELYPVL